MNFPAISKADDPDIGMLKNPRLVSETNKTLMKTIKSHTDKGEFIVTIGGDHSLGIGTVGATLNAFPEACVIWVDAHAVSCSIDINTPDTTETGNLHGCPISFLLSSLHAGKDVESFQWIKPCLKPDRLVYIGLRDVDMGERKILKDNNIRCFTMHDVDKHGIGKVVEMALESVNKGLQRPIHLSFDVDALDPSVAPSTGTPVRGGLTFREGHYICEAIYETGCLVALDLMEVNPTLMTTEADVIQTLSVGQSLVRSAMGESLI
ncbi:arginase [Puccinia sorghi]|uniref:Arginase n=1 Tax=Puccinia sorghi TaxID=27349 RepID=A0A0L6UVE8_9BASI|nr:arginase [Puccinia sorghi]